MFFFQLIRKYITTENTEFFAEYAAISLLSLWLTVLHIRHLKPYTDLVSYLIDGD
jgi:hypothetical protein